MGGGGEILNHTGDQKDQDKMRMVKSEKALRVRRIDWKEIYQNANSGWRWWCVLREGLGLAHLFPQETSI